MAQELQPGEHVSWSYGAGQAKGQVVKKLTENKKLGSRVFKASPQDPKYLVKSDTSGKEAVKKPETLHKIVDEDTGTAGAPAKESAAPMHLQDQSMKDDGDTSRQEVGAKEKRDEFRQRSSKEEKKEADSEKSAKKVVKTGTGSVRASAEAAELGKLKQVAEAQEGNAVEHGEGEKQKDKEGTVEDMPASLPVDKEGAPGALEVVEAEKEQAD